MNKSFNHNFHQYNAIEANLILARKLMAAMLDINFLQKLIRELFNYRFEYASYIALMNIRP